MASTPTQRILAARVAAYTRWSQTEDRTAATAPARAGRIAKFERQVDPDGVLTPAERTRRAGLAQKAFMSSIALKSLKSRRSKTGKRSEPKLTKDAA